MDFNIITFILLVSTLQSMYKTFPVKQEESIFWNEDDPIHNCYYS